jgi:hypothetical protein
VCVCICVEQSHRDYVLYNFFPETNEKIHILSEPGLSIRTVTVFSLFQMNTMMQLSRYTNTSTSLTESKLQHSESVIYRHDLQNQLLSNTYSLTNMLNCNNACMLILIKYASLHLKSQFLQIACKFSVC